MPLRSKVELTQGDSMIRVEMLDISLGGLGVSASGGLKPGTGVTVKVWPVGSSSIPGTVVTSEPARMDDDEAAVSVAAFRLGIRFASLSEETSQKLAVLLAPIAADGAFSSSTDAAGRERLYQRAFKSLQARDHRRAREHIASALAGDPHNLHFRAFRHRVSVEEALGRGRLVEAARELQHALALRPDDDELLALRLQLDARLRRGRLGSVIIAWVRRLLPSLGS
jgi:hypothetical protein